jgi:hypothetical protein
MKMKLAAMRNLVQLIASIMIGVGAVLACLSAAGLPLVSMAASPEPARIEPCKGEICPAYEREKAARPIYARAKSAGDGIHRGLITALR